MSMITDHEAALEIMRLQAEIELWRDSYNRLRSEMGAQSLRANTAEADNARIALELEQAAARTGAVDPELARLRAEVERLTEHAAKAERGSWESAKKIQTAEADNARLREELEGIGRYKGEGGPSTPWREIVRDIGEQARAALAKEVKT